MKVNEIIPSYNMEKFMKDLMSKTHPVNYPKNSISIRESVSILDIDNVKKAEELCNQLNSEITKTIMNFSNKNKLTISK
jgi:hypothetical protein